MTVTSQLAEGVQLNLLSFDASGGLLADWLDGLLSGWLGKRELWLLLEQMHRFDFLGPEVAAIRPLLSGTALGTYGLRGRLFWETGQVEWRRLNSETHRVVVIAEGTPVVPPANVEPTTAARALEVRDDRLVMWGTSRQESNGRFGFYEQRVAGAAPLRYPALLEEAAAITQSTGYPVLPVRTYVNAEGEEEFRRFQPPTVCDDRTLQEPSRRDFHRGGS